MFGGPDPRLCAEAPDPGQRSEVGAGPMSLTDLTPFAGHIVSWGGLNPYLPSLKETDTTRSVHDGAGVSGAWRSPASTVRLKVPARRGSRPARRGRERGERERERERDSEGERERERGRQGSTPTPTNPSTPYTPAKITSESRVVGQLIGPADSSRLRQTKFESLTITATGKQGTGLCTSDSGHHVSPKPSYKDATMQKEEGEQRQSNINKRSGDGQRTDTTQRECDVMLLTRNCCKHIGMS